MQCYHHHDFEFRHYGNDVGLDLLLANTSAENVGLELDTYWTARGGRSPQQTIADLKGRVKIVHLRDMRLQRKLFKLAPVDCALGDGNLDFRRIVDSCVDNKVSYIWPSSRPRPNRLNRWPGVSATSGNLDLMRCFNAHRREHDMILDQFKLDGKVAIVTGASRGWQGYGPGAGGSGCGYSRRGRQ